MPSASAASFPPPSASTRKHNRGKRVHEATASITAVASPTVVRADGAIFEVTPHEIIFHSFVPGSTYEASLELKNRSQKSRLVRVARPDSRFFSITPPIGASTSLTIAPGLSIFYKVYFSPEENGDYAYDLAVMTDGEEFTVPLRAYANRGDLGLPETFTVSDTPVRGSSQTSLFLRNTEREPCVWRAVASQPFAISPPFGTVAPDGGVLPVHVLYAPRELGECHDTIVFYLGPNGDVVHELPVNGTAIEVGITLDSSSIVFGDTFVTLERQAVVRVTNSSDHTVAFCWKADPRDDERVSLPGGGYGTSPGMSDGSVSLPHSAESHSAETRENFVSPGRVFIDDVFSVEPASGIVYGRGYRDFTVTFNPQLAIPYMTSMFLDIAGQQRRLPVELSGEGLGPQCKLEYTKLSIGDIFTNALHEYTIELENVGCTEALYAVLPAESVMGKKFTFSPTSGALAPGDVQVLTVQFQSGIVGVISETFYIHLHGSLEDLSLQFKGRVMTPTFEFDVDELDFGNVSYNFWHSRSFHITNTSQIAMSFSLHLPSHSPHEPEFTILPTKGVIAPMHTEMIQVDFLSNTVGEYDTALLVDIEGVGTAVDSLPLKAMCTAVPLTLSMEKLNYGRCFVGYSYTMNLEVVNPTAMSGKFEVVMLGESAALKDLVEVVIDDPARVTPIHILDPLQKVQVPITLRTLNVGSISFSLYLRILGASDPPQMVLVSAVSCGPDLEVQPSNLSFGQISVLQDVERCVTLTNTSPISANFTVRFGKKVTEYPVFRVEPEQGVVAPHSSFDVKVIACPDEAMLFTDDVILDVQYNEGRMQPIPIKATGTGFPIVSSRDLADVNLGDIFTNTPVKEEIVIFNKGRHHQEIQWHNTRGIRVKEGSQPIIFYFKPERAVIPARGQMTFVIQGSSSGVGSFSDEFFMKHSASYKEVMRSKVTGHFMAPVLSYSRKVLQFDYVYGADGPEGDTNVSKSVTMKNVSSKALVVILKVNDTKSPFSLVGDFEFPLPSGEARVIGVRFNPLYRDDNVSHEVTSRILVSFRNHSHKESLKLVGKLTFPSIAIEPHGDIDFGTIMRNTDVRRELILRNTSDQIPATFSWTLHGPQDTPNVLLQSGVSKDAVEDECGKIKQLDIIPFCGTIPPGGDRAVEVVFYGHSGSYASTAVCTVRGGQDYSLKVSGASGDVRIMYDHTVLDFGVMEYYKAVTKTITLTNPSHVAVNVTIDTSSMQNPHCLKVVPLSGVMKDKMRIHVTFTPTIPDEIHEVFFIQAGHFDPQAIRVKGMGQVSSLAVVGMDKHATVTRRVGLDFERCLRKVRSMEETHQKTPYITKTHGLVFPERFVDPTTLEAERLALCSALMHTLYNGGKAGRANDAAETFSLQEVAAKTQLVGDLDSTAQSLLPMDLGESTTDNHASPPYRLMRRSSTTSKGSMKHILGHYIVDFGHMTRCDVRSTSIRLINTSAQSIISFLTAKELAATPVSVQPMKIPSIPPLGEITLGLTLNLASTEVPIVSGQNSFEFTIDIKSGPVVVVECRCYVAMPGLQLGSTTLDFGDVLLGQVSVQSLLLSNEQAVPCSWSVKVKEKAAKPSMDGATADRVDSAAIVAQDNSSVWCNITKGLLAPYEHMMLEVYFSPLRAKGTTAVLHFRYSSNPKGNDVVCKGSGRVMNVTVDSPRTELPVARPFQVVHQTVVVTNHEDYPVEVFSCNLDPEYRQELVMLERTVQCLPSKKLILPVRVAGDSLPFEWLEALYMNYYMRATDSMRVEREAEHGGRVTELECAPSAAEKLTSSHPSNGTWPAPLLPVGAGTSVLLADQPLALSSPSRCVLLFVGPPQSGKTTMAQEMGRQLGFVSLEVDALITSEAQRDTANGEVIRNVLDALRECKGVSGAAATSRRGRPGVTPPLDSVLSMTLNNLHSYSAAAQDSQGTNLIDRTTNRRATQSSGVAASSCVRFVPGVIKQILHAYMSDMAQKDPKAGFIVDGLTCCLSNNLSELYLAILAVCGMMGYPLHVVSLAVSEDTVGLRNAFTAQRLCLERLESAHVESLSETEFEALSLKEQDDYNRKLKYFNECKRDVAAASKKVRQYQISLAESPKPTVQEAIEKKIDEELQRTTPRTSRKQTRVVQPEAQLPPWDELSPMEAFKELHRYILMSGSERAEETWKHHIINCESEVRCDVLAGTIYDTITNQQPQEMEGENKKVVDEEERDNGSHQDTVAPFGGSTTHRSSASKCGVWSYVDPQRLRHMSKKHLEFFRFFSQVEREVIPQKNSKAKEQYLVRLYEELTRWLIPAKSSVSIAVEFCCGRPGEHSAILEFGVVGTQQVVEVPVSAQVVVPDVIRDDKIIFPLVRTRMAAGKSPSRVFLTAKRTYDFGSLLIPAPATSKRGRSTKGSLQMETSKRISGCTSVAVELEATETLTFTNTGACACEVALGFRNEKESTFSVSPHRFSLALGGTQQVILRAAPDGVGEITNTLIACVVGNPHPWSVAVACTGSRPALTLDGKKELSIDLGRSVLNRTTEHIITLANTSRLPIYWKVQGAGKMPPELQLSDTCGTIDENGVYPLTVVFAPSNTCCHTVQLQVVVTDASRQAQSYEVLPLTIQGEAHDVVLEWTRKVDFKLLHVGESRKETIRVLNKGLYDVGFQFRLPKRLQQVVKVTPQEGVVRGLMGYKDAAIATIDITARFEREGELSKKLGFVEVAFFSVEEKELLYPLQTIPILGEAWYTHFSVKPSHIDFGPCFFLQRKQSQFEVCNTGRFPVTFRLFDYENGFQGTTSADASGDAGNEDAAVTKKSTHKAAKGDQDFRIGCFTVTPVSGTIPIGESLAITVVTVPQEGCSTEKTLGIYVEQSNPAVEGKGYPVRLTAFPTTPGIAANLNSTSDMENIFEEQQVVFRLDQFDKSTKAYGKEDRTFSFGTSLVGHRVEERFRITNSSALPCTVVTQLQSINPLSKLATLPDGFDLSPDADDNSHAVNFVLPPFESRFVSVGFAPSALQSFHARFVATVENGTDPMTNNLTFDIIGEGVLPNVAIILPDRFTNPPARGSSCTPVSKAKTKDGSKRTQSPSSSAPKENVDNVLQLPLTLLGMCSSRSFTLKNIGDIPAEVRLAIVSNETETNGLTVPKRNREISIPVGSEEVFEVLYAPQKVEKNTMTLHVSLMDNPFDDKELTVQAESFYQAISFDPTDPSSSDYVDAGTCCINDTKSCTVNMRNNTSTTLRYQWSCPTEGTIDIVPLIGHIAAGAAHPVTLNISCTESAVQRVLACNLMAQSITVADPVDWDSSMVSQKWVVADETLFRTQADIGRRGLRKVMEPVPEPPHTVIDTVTIDQVLKIGYTCDTPTYSLTLVGTDGKELPLTVIAFPMTKIFQRRIVTLRVTNTGVVGLPFEFDMSVPQESLSDGEETPVSFYTEPAGGIVPVGEAQDISIVFAPQRAGETVHTLVGRFAFSEASVVHIPLHGSAECPLVHFQIPHSDYLSTRVDGEAGPVIDRDTLVAEFLTRGLHTRTTMHFKVINPTTMSYQFEWLDHSHPCGLSPFRCLTQSGSITGGKQLDMAFEFTGNTLGIREALWSFQVDGKAAVPFLLVGKTVEPDVFFDHTKIMFGSVYLGNKVERITMLENRDDVPFTFTFDKADMESLASFLVVKPSAGTVGPREKLPVSVLFAPTEEMEYNAPLVCRIKKASIPLTINVKGEGVCIHDALHIDTMGGEGETLSVPKGTLYHLQLGRVQVDQRVTRRFILVNDGQQPFEYAIIAPERRHVTLEGTVGVVQRRQSAVCMLVYHPTTEEHLRSYRIQFRVGGKVTYQVVVQATSYIPNLRLSFERFDFGPRFITQFASGAMVSTTLTISNSEKEVVVVDCSLADENDWCELDSTSLTLRPGANVNVKLTFTPHAVRMYDDKLKLLLNGVHAMYVPISGEGVTPRVEVLNHFAKLGVARVGELRESVVKLECRSRIATPISFVGCIDDDLVRKGVSVGGIQNILLRPKEVRGIPVHFKPTQRMGEFQQEMKMLVCGTEAPFAVVAGSCQDAEMHLDITSLVFSDVVVGSSVTRRVVIMNSGDISQKFSWAIRGPGELKIAPSAGFIRSHTECICEVTYTPSRPSSSLRRSVAVEFDNSPPLSLLVEANGITRRPAKERVVFTCKARESCVNMISLENGFDCEWTVEPVVDNKLFTCPKSVYVAPRERTEIAVTYAPQKATPPDDPDEGSIFFPQPDGTGLTFTLEGRAEGPGPSAPLIGIEVEVKTTHTQKFTVRNWGSSQLRFFREVQWTPAPEDGVLIIKGPNSVDVPPNSLLDYNLPIVCMTAGSYRGVVSFRCPEREDMLQYYEVSLKVSSNISLVTAELRAAVRTSSVYNIPVSNHLAKNVTVTCKVEGAVDSISAPASLTVPAKSARQLPVEFFPLINKEYPDSSITISSAELGISTYLLHLHSSAEIPEKVTRLTCPLGQNVPFSLRFTHYSKVNTDFAIRIGNETGGSKYAVFTRVEQGMTLKAQATTRPKGQELVACFTYEPLVVGCQGRETIEFVSPVGGTYAFPIVATCTGPQRQGPFIVHTGQNTSVSFKNVFTESVNISISTDSPYFVVTKKSENVAAKKTISIPIQCKLDDAMDVARCKLIITCIPPESTTPVEWVYYLEGVRTEGTAKSFAAQGRRSLRR